MADDLVAAYDKMIDEAHAQDGGTITPIKKSFYIPVCGKMRGKKSIKGLEIGHFDAVIDLDKAIRDTEEPLIMVPGAQSGDYLHPNERGYQIWERLLIFPYSDKWKTNKKAKIWKCGGG